MVKQMPLQYPFPTTFIFSYTYLKQVLRNQTKIQNNALLNIIKLMQEARDALSKLQTVNLFRPIRSLQCSWFTYWSPTALKRPDRSKHNQINLIMFNKALFWIFVWFLKTWKKSSPLSEIYLKQRCKLVK